MKKTSIATATLIYYIITTVLLLLFSSYLFYQILLIAVGFSVVFVFVTLGLNYTVQHHITNLNQSIINKDLILKRKESIQEHVMQDSPIGIIVLDDAYRIGYANQHAQSLFENTLENKALNSIHQGIFKALKEDSLTHTKIFKIYDEYYEIHHDKDNETLFLYRVSERETLKRAYDNYTTTIGVLHLDNFDDALSVLDVQEKNEIQGLYYGAIDDWADKYDMHVISISSSKLYVTMHKKNLDDVIQDKFSILNDIAYISKEHDLIVTLSGGFACANIPHSDLASSAEEALDQALGRGGDQIAININGEDYLYFGGNTNTQEKRTRISSRIHAKKLDLLIQDASKVFIMPHTHPDTDALGSAIGMLKMVLSHKKEAHIVLDDNIDKTVSKILTLMEYEYVTLRDYFIDPDQAMQYLDKDSLLILVDHHSYGQVLDDKLVNKSHKIAIIDHHRKLADPIEDVVLSYVEPYASSSSELIVEMISVYPHVVELNPFEATVLLAGMIVDTNNFMYRTGSRTFEAAAVLRKYGADTYKIKNVLRESLKDIQIKSQLLSRVEVVNKRYALVVVPDDIDSTRTMLAQIADNLLEIDHVVAAFVIGTLDKQVVGISARSLEGFSVQQVMEHFGGGGHLNNAGAQLENTTKEAVKTELIQTLETLKQEGRPMKVILQKDVKNKGKKGDVIEVPAGYGNYLLTSKAAIEATPENLNIIEDEKQKAEAEKKQNYEEMKALKKRIDYRAVKVYVKLGTHGKLYGKINTKQIAEAFKSQHGLDIDKRKIQLNQPIDTLGTYEIEVKLHKDVSATFELMVLEKHDG